MAEQGGKYQLMPQPSSCRAQAVPRSHISIRPSLFPYLSFPRYGCAVGFAAEGSLAGYGYCQELHERMKTGERVDEDGDDYGLRV